MKPVRAPRSLWPGPSNSRLSALSLSRSPNLPVPPLSPSHPPSLPPSPTPPLFLSRSRSRFSPLAHVSYRRRRPRSRRRRGGGGIRLLVGAGDQLRGAVVRVVRHGRSRAQGTGGGRGAPAAAATLTSYAHSDQLRPL